MMPTFPFSSSMAEYVASSTLTDLRSSPSHSGLLSEVFRTSRDVQRSNHPTHPVAAWGQDAGDWIAGNERSSTPYGAETPLARLARHPRGQILMLDTHVHSYAHLVQDLVEFPNLYQPGEMSLPFVDLQGRMRQCLTRIMQPLVPYYVAVPSPAAEPDWVAMRDFITVFPRRRRNELRDLGALFPMYQEVWKRPQVLEDQGALRMARLGRGDIGVLHSQGTLAVVEAELRRLISDYRVWYDPERILALGLPYF